MHCMKCVVSKDIGSCDSARWRQTPRASDGANSATHKPPLKFKKKSYRETLGKHHFFQEFRHRQHDTVAPVTGYNCVAPARN